MTLLETITALDADYVVHLDLEQMREWQRAWNRDPSKIDHGLYHTSKASITIAVKFEPTDSEISAAVEAGKEGWVDSFDYKPPRTIGDLNLSTFNNLVKGVYK